MWSPWPHNNLQSYLKHPSKFLETFLKHPQNPLWSSLSTLKTSPKYSSIIIETPYKLLWNNLKNLLETPFKSIRNTIETIEDFKDTKGKKGRTKTRTHELIEWQRLFLSSSSQLKISVRIEVPILKLTWQNFSYLQNFWNEYFICLEYWRKYV